MKIGFREFNTDKHDRYTKLLSRRAVIENVKFSLWSADVRVVGGAQSIIKNVPMSNLISFSVKAGDYCALDLFDENNPNDCIVSYIYGAKPNIMRSGKTLVSSTTIPHGLGRTPNFIYFIFADDPGNDGVYESATADATNIYLACNHGSSHYINWYCTYIQT